MSETKIDIRDYNKKLRKNAKLNKEKAYIIIYQPEGYFKTGKIDITSCQIMSAKGVKCSIGHGDWYLDEKSIVVEIDPLVTGQRIFNALTLQEISNNTADEIENSTNNLENI